ncbi:MAG: MmcQ/YjbR family DNA-binding protein [Raineya sp.]
MNVETFREHCLKKKGVIEEFPFDNTTLVFKVMGKIFALTNIASEEFSISLKCSPEEAISLREQYETVQAGYHLNKKHWNTIYANRDIPDRLLTQWIDKSYELVVQGLPKKAQKYLKNL